MKIYADHWLYNYIPSNHDILVGKPCWQKITWALFGNDNDGIFGEGPKSGTRWTERWGGKTTKRQVGENLKVIKFHEPGSINFKRFVLWQLRNPLHNFTGYILGFKNKKDVSYKRVIFASTAGIEGYKDIPRPHVFPMNDKTGIYLGLHNSMPFVSWRINFKSIRWLEGYWGWRPGGAFGAALRLKKTIKIKP